MAHQYMPKIVYDPHKNPVAPLPTYLIYDPLTKNIFSEKLKKLEVIPYFKMRIL